MQTTKLDTVDGVTERIQRVIEANNRGRDLKPGAWALRAAALADLHELRAQLFAEIDLSGVPAGQLGALSLAVAKATEKDRDSARFWRQEAGRR